ncbi:unnamed protein product [Cuscuta epithymum]|uniref:Uncharacterized protein n=1 Tax=Cuscuta epithymum TaxID=186058 RepID=A0AAV0CJ68_9ASTE|nr:unnamed protein product [Cuscuta epithymum]
MAIMTFPASSIAAVTKKPANRSHQVPPALTDVFGVLRPRRVFARRSWPKGIAPVKKPSRNVISSTHSASVSFSEDSGKEFDSDCESSCSSTASSSHPTNPRPDEDDDIGKKDVPMWKFVPKSSTSFILVRVPN